jgi:5-methylcytosine-specific restriction endonuclease McrA
MERLDREFDHKNGDCSNNKMSNCQALHTRCHRKKTSKIALNKRSIFNI